MTPAARRRTTRSTRALQGLCAGTALVLAGGLVAGSLSEPVPTGTPDVVITGAGHHAAPSPEHHAAAVAAPPAGGSGSGTDPAGEPVGELGPGLRLDASGRVVHDHGDLEVAVMLGEDGETRVRGPLRPGAWFSLVNHTTTDQVLRTEDETLRADVPLVRLVTLRAPTAPGTYRLVSTTDPTVVAELVVEGPPV